MFVYIARHAWAGERGDPRWPDDSLRQLTPEGIERYDEVVQAARQSRLRAAADRHQPLRSLPTDGRDHRQARRRQSADRRARRLGTGLLLGAGDRVDQQARRRRRLLGRPQPRRRALRSDAHRRQLARIRFAKGAIAAIEFDEEVIAGGGELYWLATAKLLGL